MTEVDFQTLKSVLGDMSTDEPLSIQKMRTKTVAVKSAKRRYKHCPSGKTMHTTKKRALSSANAVVRTQHADLIRIYKCPICHHHHLTSKEQRKRGTMKR
jgi:hypothetical protein